MSDECGSRGSLSVLTGSEFLVLEQLKSHHLQSANVWATHIPQVAVAFVSKGVAEMFSWQIINQSNLI